MNDDDSDTSSECFLDFANIDLSNVDFDEITANDNDNNEFDSYALELEKSLLIGNFKEIIYAKQHRENDGSIQRLIGLGTMVADGKYIEALSSSDSAKLLFGGEDENGNGSTTGGGILHQIRNVVSKLQTLSQCVEAEFLAIAAFNLFLQLNYTGPTIDDDEEKASLLASINPHKCFANCLNHTEDNAKYHGTVLSELAVDGSWPCEVSVVPYMLLLARSILSTLCNATSTGWSVNEEDDQMHAVPSELETITNKLVTPSLWSARATVAHERLLLTREPTTILWNEAHESFMNCNKHSIFCGSDERHVQTTTMLEYGLACHHFGYAKKAKAAFKDATTKSGLSIELTGVEGVRTKFQRKATSQMTVLAMSASTATTENIAATTNKEDTSSPENKNPNDNDHEEEKKRVGMVKSQMVELSEDNVLLERVKYSDEKANEVSDLLIRDQAILLAFCLDVKNNNPADGLTAEEMNAYLSRVLCHHDDWMVFSTALLERAWLDFESTHTKERSILQMQALADQHTNRLTITQSTKKSVEELSPVQDRLKNIHSIVYPPRWQMLKDVADRYASLGIVTSAAEIFVEIEYWDEAVACYRRAGKLAIAEEIIRNRLEKSETPSMWVALGDVVKDPECYEKAIALSCGRYLQAYISAGAYYFEKGDPTKAIDNYRQALKLRPLQPVIWFKVGTLAMQLEDWELALAAFSEVVQQQPDEAEGWANVGAVHMHNKNPGEAYGAILESLKQNRNNWRVWENKLFVCLDLNKYDEAVQACNMLLDLRSNEVAEGQFAIEERCVRAIVGGVVGEYEAAKEKGDSMALGSARRSLTRVHGLIERIGRTSNEAWMFETAAYFHGAIGKDEAVYDYLMKEYRSLSSVRAWESDDFQTRKVCQVVLQIAQCSKGDKEKLTKSKFLLGGVIKQVEQSRFDKSKIPEELDHVRNLLTEVTEELKST